MRSLSVALWEGRKAIRFCSVCGNYAAAEVCSVCADQTRHNGQICVVRDPRDVAALERTHDYGGLYHVLHGTLSPMEGI
ncbi:MAG: toprim domain-containing protein, partial [Lachnospiraceae bacterium]|nr:toprim domain-containing protein [Lachnospiraceae bacterium]